MDLIDPYAFGTSSDPVYKKEQIKCNNIIKIQKQIKFDYITKENIQEHDLILLEIPDHHTKY